MKSLKQILASLLVAVMLVAIPMVAPMKADATETTEIVVNGENGVIYVLDEVNYNFKNLWANKTAPTRDDYVFGGWYTKGNNDTFTAITQTVAEEGNVDTTTTWAKFVPAEVLSVRAQLEAETEENNGTNVTEGKTTYLRLLSAVNGLNYQSIGFDIKYNKTYADPKADVSNNITKVYETITNAETEEGGIKANAVFGEAATHFSVLRLEKIYSRNFNLVIYVRPHWTTLDGTTVYGQAKYVRVMDGYSSNHYISVPVNFLTGSTVAAGQLEMIYDSRLEVVTVDGMGFDTGKLMPKMAFYDDKAGKIKIVGNIAEGTGVEPETEIFANVWFKVKDSATDTSDITAWNFEMKNLSFCNWEEKMITDVSAWNFKYLK